MRNYLDQLFFKNGCILSNHIFFIYTYTRTRSFEDDILTKVIELKKLIAYRTDRQYFSITNLKMLKKFKIICKKKKLNYIK